MVIIPLLLLLLNLHIGYYYHVAGQSDCSPIYVRWSRVKLNLTPRIVGSYSLQECSEACSKNENPSKPGSSLECLGFNHQQGANNLSHDCQIFQQDQTIRVDDHVEADDRHSFYWKYCAKTKSKCKSAYQFDFYIDRYMDLSEVERTIRTDKIEDCLNRCLDEPAFVCRSVSFNRTGNLCSLSPQSQQTKSGSLRVNNNPNYRIDYYENVCSNGSFTFHHDCRPNGVVISVESKFPYTGALYALYDFFSCRVEPKQETKFSLFLPFPDYSKNCSDSYSRKESFDILDVVLSTDGMEPLYFLTDQDTLYQAKCPANDTSKSTTSSSIVSEKSSLSSTSPSFTDAWNSFSSLPSILTTSSTQEPINTTFSISESYTVESTSASATNSSEVVNATTVYSTEPISSSWIKTSELSKFSQKPFITLPVLDVSPSVVLKFNEPEPEPKPKIGGGPGSDIFDSHTKLTTAESTVGTTKTNSKVEITSTSTIKENATSASTLWLVTEPAFSPSTSTYSSTTAFTTGSIGAESTTNSSYTLSSSSSDAYKKDWLENKRQTTSAVDTTKHYTETYPLSNKNVPLPTVQVSAHLDPVLYISRTPSPDSTSVTFTSGSTPITTGSTLGGSRLSTFSEWTTNRTSTTGPDKILNQTEFLGLANVTISTSPSTVQQKVIFDILHNNQPVSVVVVASRIALSFKPGVPGSSLSVLGCQVEPVNSPYASERDPIQIIKNGCQADGVGLVCPPVRIDSGVRIEMEALRYTHTSEILFSCLVRICSFGQCPQAFCKPVDGCSPSSPSLFNNINAFNFGGVSPVGRKKRQFPQPFLPLVPSFQIPGAFQQNLLPTGNDLVISKKLVVVNTEAELQYYFRTGNVPSRNAYFYLDRPF